MPGQAEELALYLGTLIGCPRSAREVAMETGRTYAQVRLVFRALRDLGLADRINGRDWIAMQRDCLRCGRLAEELRGGDVDPETLRWMCIDCFNDEVATLEAMAW